MSKQLTLQWLLKRITKQLEAMIARELLAFGITPPQILVMRQIVDSPKTIGEIVKAIDLSYSTVSGIIDRLEKNGIVRRTRDTNDRRVVWISLTEKRLEIKNRISVLQDDYLDQLVSEIDPAKLDLVLDVLSGVYEKLLERNEEKP